MSTAKSDSRPDKITTRTVVDMKSKGEKISMITAYDYTMARIVDHAGIDIILVGDSASNVMAGHETTLPITLDQMIYHTSCVVRGVDRALVVADLPFMSYQVPIKEALISAGRMMKEAGVGYGAINHPVDRDPICGYTGVIGDVCPNCGRTEEDGYHFERIRRITGYLVGTVERFNNAKRAEERNRIKHT